MGGGRQLSAFAVYWQWFYQSIVKLAIFGLHFREIQAIVLAWAGLAITVAIARFTHFAEPLLYCLCVFASIVLAKAWASGNSFDLKSAKAGVYGRVIVMTGASSGIGNATCTLLASCEPELIILGVRGGEKRAKLIAESIRAMAEKYAHRPLDKMEIVGYDLDLSRFASVKSFADQVKAKTPHIDILINNAGIAGVEEWKDYKLTEDGYDEALQANFMSHVLLTELLMENLKKAPDCKVVNLSSIAHVLVKLKSETEIPELALKHSYELSSLRQYALSKLAMIWHVRELVKHHHVKAYAAHPGFINTNIIHDIQITSLRLLWIALLTFGGKSMIQGAQTTLFCALADTIPPSASKHPLPVPGELHQDCKVSLSTKQAKNETLSHKMYTHLLNNVFPKYLQN